MAESMRDVKAGAVTEFNERLRDEPDTTEPHDIIHEVADSHVPVYNGELLEMAASDFELALNVPELGPAFDGRPTPVNIIAANVFEAIEAALWERWREYETERDDAAETA